MSVMSDVAKGLNIFMKYDSEGQMTTSHDVIFASSLGENDKLTPEELALLDEAGWFFDSEVDSWAKFV